MPVYTAAEPKGTKKPSSNLAARGIELECCTMTTVAPTGFAEYPQIAYQNYKGLIAAFMKATMEGKVLACTKKGYPLNVKTKDCIQFPPPPLVFSFETKLSTAKSDALLALGCTTYNQGKEIFYSLRDYDIVETLPKLLAHDPKPNTRTRAPMGSSNISGIRSFMTCLRIVTAFLATHSYAAFDGPQTGDMGGRYDSIPEFITTKRKGHFGDRRGKRPHREEEEDIAMEDEIEDIDELGVEDFAVGTEGKASERVPKAKPTDPVLPNIGGVSQVPTLPGLLFPYFQGLLEDDRQFIPSVVRAYFMQCLGSDRNEICSAFQDFRGGCGMWASSETGRLLQHVFAGIQMAIEAQARLYLINDRNYNGFTLHGWYFHVSIHNRIYVPLEWESLSVEVRKVDEHANAILDLIRLLSTLKVDKNCPKDYKTLPKKLADIKGARHLHELITWRLRDDEANEKIDGFVAETSFTQRFRPFTADNIVRAIEWIVNDEAVPVDEPMFLGGGLARRTERTLEAFSIFGELGPSFLVPGGKGLKIPSSIADDTMLEPVKTGPPPLNVMVIAKKPLISCLNDWDTLLRTGVYLNRVERAAAFKSIRIADKDEIRKVWHCLIENVGKNFAKKDEGYVGAASEKVLGKRVDREDDEFADFF